MVEPFSLGALGAIALTDGIKFLYAQAGEILKRRRERKDTADAPPAAGPARGRARPAPARPGRRRRAGPASCAACATGSPTSPTTSSPPRRPTREVVAATLALREAIEAIVGQRITFRGEQREPTGTPTITGNVRARELHGRASGVDSPARPPSTSDGEVIVDIGGENADIAGVRVSGDVSAQTDFPTAI